MLDANFVEAAARGYFIGKLYVCFQIKSWPTIFQVSKDSITILVDECLIVNFLQLTLVALY